jgi:hypothetical protein
MGRSLLLTRNNGPRRGGEVHGNAREISLAFKNSIDQKWRDEFNIAVTKP